ncbi:hypothetical protein HYALB_00011479 [Hymenoscyphus albidus]|uniref:Uncharacterized protein n=1 Tax=Hymenoscyphus albidus TaxID=595503 RepID=A0A9N9LJW4_9HELO|nr:hypothetical protein HYALB_00011479 [Hymenoscyphus albidus]
MQITIFLVAFSSLLTCGGLTCLPSPSLSDMRPAKAENIQLRADQLKSRDECGVNPNSCIQVACNNGDGIYLCNDDYSQAKFKCSDVAAYALDIKDNRPATGGGVGGQVFDTDRCKS